MAKTAASGKSHGMRAVCTLSASLLNENYIHLLFKERLPNGGYSTLIGQKV